MRLIPAWTLLSMGREDCSLGSGSPIEICISLMAARYHLIVCGARPTSARYATYEHSSCSVAGKGSATLYLVQNAWNFLIAES